LLNIAVAAKEKFLPVFYWQPNRSLHLELKRIAVLFLIIIFF